MLYIKKLLICISHSGRYRSLLRKIVFLCIVIPAANAADTDELINSMPPAANNILKYANQIPAMIDNNQISYHEIPNPHWRDDSCVACHEGDPTITPVKYREQSVEKICSYCHGNKEEHINIHPVDIVPDPEMFDHMPAAYQDALKTTKGIITCLTCHDLYKQCLPKFRLQKGLNPSFFRNGPFKNRYESCFFCHNSSDYNRLNAHDQIDNNGRLNKNSCRICHNEDLDILLTKQGIENLDFFNLQDLSLLCTGCHQVEPHPVVLFAMSRNNEPADHLVKPSDKKYKRMQAQTEKDGIEMPLEPGTEKIFCGTCHNPHEKGVLINTSGSIGSDVEQRLRQTDKKICVHCHDI